MVQCIHDIEHCQPLIEAFVQEHNRDKHNDKAGKKGLKRRPEQLIKLIKNL